MDWPKAKSILIIGFLLVDLYLAWMLYASSRVSIVTALTAEDVQDLIRLSQHYGVELLSTPTPLKVGKAPGLSMVEETDAETVARAVAGTWLGTDWIMSEPAAGSFLFHSGDWSLRVTPGRFFVESWLEWEGELAAEQEQPASADHAEGLARSFLATHLGQTEADQYHSGLFISNQEVGEQVIEFNQTYLGLPSFLNYYRLQIVSGQVTGFQACQSQVSQEVGPKQQLVAADRPLKKYLAQVGMQSEPMQVLDLRLGYGLLPGEEGVMQPLWRLIVAPSGGEQEEVLLPAGIRYWGVENR
ncbi:MAG: hypothetical protein ACOX2K_11210 [Bacillota bacterium]